MAAALLDFVVTTVVAFEASLLLLAVLFLAVAAACVIGGCTAAPRFALPPAAVTAAAAAMVAGTAGVGFRPVARVVLAFSTMPAKAAIAGAVGLSGETGRARNDFAGDMMGRIGE